MRKKIITFAIFTLFVVVGLIPSKAAFAEVCNMKILGVNSAYKSLYGDYGRVNNYQQNEFTPISLTTKYPCILVNKTNNLGPLSIYVDGKYLCDYDVNNNTDDKDIYSWGCDVESDTTSYEIIFNNLKSGNHRIMVNAKDAYKNSIGDFIDIVLP
ncbi:hypothetical protein NL50_04165 [Clostridium acetobutylicum]|nr:hypothetical protein NL50_04165 [Clostridium acetobutylicum]